MLEHWLQQFGVYILETMGGGSGTLGVSFLFRGIDLKVFRYDLVSSFSFYKLSASGLHVEFMLRQTLHVY